MPHALSSAVQELSRRLGKAGAAAFSVHPGVIATPLWREDQGPAFLAKVPFLPRLSAFLPRLLADRTVAQGAATTLFACLAPGLAASFNGAYLTDCDVGVPSAAILRDPSLSGRLWDASLEAIAEARAEIGE